jgi:ABC-type amino acid transport system permease subunit
VTPETRDVLRAHQQATVAEILRREARAMERGQLDAANELAGLRGSLARLWALQEPARGD